MVPTQSTALEFIVAEFLKPFVNELCVVIENNFSYNNKTYNVNCRAIVCDAPARALVMGIKGHTGNSCCHKCTQIGEYKNLDISIQVVSALRPMFIRLTNEMQSLKNEVKALKQQKLTQKKTVIPFATMEEFLGFEKKVQEDAEVYSTFEQDLASVAKASNFVKNCWRKIFVHALAENLCWKGTEQKKSVRSLSVAKAIRNLAIGLGQTEDDFIKSTKTFFQFAKSRGQSRANYKPTPAKMS